MSTWPTFSSKAVLAAAALAAVAASGSTPQVDRRAQLSEGRAAAIEAFFAAVFPGASVDWNAESLVWPGGDKQRVKLSGFERRAYGDGYVLVAGVEFPDRVEVAQRGIERAERVAPGTASCRLVVVRTDAAGAAVDQRSLTVDPESSLTRCRRVEIEEAAGPEGAQWPRLRVSAETTQAGAGWAGTVTWHGLLDSGNGAWISRMPVAVSRREAGGPESTEILRARRVDAGQVEFEALGSGRKFSYACAGPAECLVPPQAVFDRLR